MSERQTINDLLMEVSKLRKDNDYLAGERDYWKQQAQRNDSVSHGCDTESGVTLRDLFGIWKDTSDQLEADTREKLEEDVRWQMGHFFAWDEKREEFVGYVLEFLDRQAAITKRECDTASWKANYRHVMKQRDELQEKVDALEAECQKDIENVTDWEDSCDTREILDHDCKWMAYAWAPAEYPDDKLEKKLYREIIEKLDRQSAITRAECEVHTCTLAYDGKWLICSACGEPLQWFGVRTVYKGDTQERALGVDGVRYCPFCGARIEGGESE